MCLIVFGYNCHPDYQLVLGANRHEFRNRPTDPAHIWPDASTTLFYSFRIPLFSP